MGEKKNISPFWDHLNLEEISSADGTSEIKCKVTPELLNKNGHVHGGVLATLIDVSVGSAVRSTFRGGERSATVELKINYLKPAKGPALLAKSSVSHRGKTLAVGTSQIFDENGNLLAIGTATFMIKMPDKTSG